jgi:hypothetical protein
VRSRFSPADLAPLALLAAAGVTLLVVTRGAIVANTLGSSRALLLLGGIAVAWAVLAWVVLPRVVRSAPARAEIMTVPAVALIVVLVVPYFRPTTVIETVPPVATAAATATAQATATEQASATEQATAPAPPSAPVLVSSGGLLGIGHQATGAAGLLRQPDGSLVVELREIDVESGPDYHVHLVPGAGREDPDGGTYLEPLRGTRGTQYYPVPPGVDAAGDWTVLIWCRAFGVPIAGATPVPV